MRRLTQQEPYKLEILRSTGGFTGENTRLKRKWAELRGKQEKSTVRKSARGEEKKKNP